MKKAVKIIAIILLAVILVVGIFTALSWKYISSVIVGLTSDESELGQKRVESTENTLTSMNNYMESELREMTEEEKAAIQSGEMSQTEVMARIIAEAAGVQLPSYDENGNIVSDPDAGQPQESAASGGQTQTEAPSGGGQAGTQSPQQPSGQNSGQTAAQSTPQAKPAASYDQLVAACVSKLYGLQAQYTGQIASLASRAMADYQQQKQTSGSAAAKSSIMSKYAGEVASMESSCDSKVEAALGELSSQLTAIGADTAIIGELRGAYNTEKSNQRAAYANRYLK